ncbi:MAG: MBL fold metallo-hydrolase [Aeromicrobium sp.]
MTTPAMRLTIIGCAGSFPGPDSPASCYLVEAPHEDGTFRLLLELGNGALGGLQRSVDLREIGAVAISHLHPDHCLDMCGFYVVRKYHPDGAFDPIPVFAPEGAGDYLSTAYGIDDGFGMDGQFDFHEWDESTPVTVGPFEVAVVTVDHPVPAYALRVSAGGKTLVYSGDTGPTEALAEFVRGADAFLCEASFVESRDNPPNLHLTGAEAGDYATRGDVGRLLITHIPVWTDRDEVLRDVKSTWDGDVELVTAGSVYDI